MFLLQRGALASVIPMPKVELDSPAQNAVGGASRKSSVVSKSASGVAKKKSVNGDYKKRRKQPLSEEAKVKRRETAKQAAVTRKKNAATNPRKKRNQVQVMCRRTPIYKPGAPRPKMHHPTSGRLVDIGSAEHIAAKKQFDVRRLQVLALTQVQVSAHGVNFQQLGKDCASGF